MKEKKEFSSLSFPLFHILSSRKEWFSFVRNPLFLVISSSPAFSLSRAQAFPSSSLSGLSAGAGEEGGGKKEK